MDKCIACCEIIACVAQILTFDYGCVDRDFQRFALCVARNSNAFDRNDSVTTGGDRRASHNFPGIAWLGDILACGFTCGHHACNGERYWVICTCVDCVS